MTTTLKYPFIKRAGDILNAGMSRALVLCGNIYDLFFSESSDTYVPLVDLLVERWSIPSRIPIVYELHGPIRFVREEDEKKVREAWTQFRSGLTCDQIAIRKGAAAGREEHETLEALGNDFDQKLKNANGQPAVALEFLRQLCLCSRAVVGGKRVLEERLIIVIEGADLILPEGEISRLSDTDRHRVAICQDWFSDPAFMQGGDSVVLIAESRSLIHHRIGRLPQVMDVEIPSPDIDERRFFIEWFQKNQPTDHKAKLWGTEDELAQATAALSIHALKQVLTEASYEQQTLEHNAIVQRVEAYIKSQLGDDVVEFKKPPQTLADVIGFGRLKAFIKDYLIPRIKARGKAALSGAAVAGPIGAGKTFIFEAMAGELGIPILVIKNIRSQWFGQTDVLWERFRRVIGALDKVLIFVDEADTQFGGVGQDVHETERRLTGKMQAMMSDVALRGRVFWLLMTARIHSLSPDIRRPGRVGDLIIPVLDPTGEDRKEFLTWMLKGFLDGNVEDILQKVEPETVGYSAASFASLKAELQALTEMRKMKLSLDTVLEVVHDHLPPPIGATRRFQELQALINCTRRSLLPNPSVTEEERIGWEKEIALLERLGIR